MTLSMQRAHFLTACILFTAFCAYAQDDKNAVTYEELYDEPFAVNKLFIGFQPIYAELSATNVNAGFGVNAAYYYQDKADFFVNLRMPYGKSFFDYNRDIASKNSDVSIQPQAFTYLEVGGTYHIKDIETAGKTKMTLYKSSYKGDKWASRVPLQTEVPAKLRTIYGVRTGVTSWRTTVYLNQVMEKQGLTNANLVNESDQSLPETVVDPVSGVETEFDVFTNMYSTTIFLGGSYGRFRNVAISFDDYEGAIDDNLLTLYFDLMFAANVDLNPVIYQSNSYSTDVIKTNRIGARLGLDGKFNRTLSWGYGGELGYRPGLSGRSFYAMFRLSFPVFGSNLENKVESFGK
jgi:hypothetical protein